MPLYNVRNNAYKKVKTPHFHEYLQQRRSKLYQILFLGNYVRRTFEITPFSAF